MPEILFRLSLEVIDVFSLIQNVRLLLIGHMKLFALGKADGLHLSQRLEMDVLYLRCVIPFCVWPIIRSCSLCVSYIGKGKAVQLQD